MAPSISVNTPLGNLNFSAVAENFSDISEFTEVALSRPEVKLPSGMVVEDLVACLLICQPRERLLNLVFQCIWDTPSLKGAPDSGERLDAQSWENATHIVMVGTEDYEALNERMPELSLREELYPIEYMTDGFRIMIPSVEPGTRLSLHYVIATNRLPEPVDCSCWYAVDINHNVVLSSKVKS